LQLQNEAVIKIIADEISPRLAKQQVDLEKKALSIFHQNLTQYIHRLEALTSIVDGKLDERLKHLEEAVVVDFYYVLKEKFRKGRQGSCN